MPSELTSLLEGRVTSWEKDTCYRPLFFRLGEQESKQAFLKLLQSDPGIQVFDTLPAQLQDLIRARHPSVKLDSGQLDALTRERLGKVPPDEYGVWVYYPWVKRMAHLLDAEEFAELRTNRNHNKITLREQALLAGKRIGVVGLSVGQAVAVTLALERSFGELRLADFDHLDLSNLNRIRTSVYNLNLSKVYLTAREIAEIDPFLEITCFPEGVTASNFEAFLLEGGKLDVVIDECDSLDVKIGLRYAARKHGIPVVMNTSDRGMLDVERFDLAPERPIFHGFIGEPDPVSLKGLTTEQKVPFVLQIMGEETISTRLRASLLEVEQTLSTWPQLASAVVYGGAMTADVVRRISLGEEIQSGRYFVDLDTCVPNAATSVEHQPSNVEAGSSEPPELKVERMKAAAQVYSRTTCDENALIPGTDVIHRLILDAAKAPSGGNCQPWRWLSDGSRLLLFSDSSRSASLLDFEQNGTIVSLGAAAENLILSAHAAGIDLRMRTLPLADFPELIAGFHLLRSAEASAEPHWRDELYPMIHARRTNRKISARQQFPAAQQEVLTQAVRSIPGADVQWLLDDDQLRECGDLIGGGDRVILLNQALNRDLMKEIRWTSADAQATGDGLDIASLELSPSDLAGLKVCRHWPSLELAREWRGGRNLEKMSRKAVVAASAVGLITMPSARRVDYFMGGRAVERCWLNATELGLAFHPMTSLPYLFARLIKGGGASLDDRTCSDLEELRERYEKLFRLTSSMAEVMLFRVSLASEPTARSFRRSVDQILVVNS